MHGQFLAPTQQLLDRAGFQHYPHRWLSSNLPAMAEPPKRWIGVDFGSKWVGVATCDESGGPPTPLTTLDARPAEALLDSLKQIALDHGAAGFVVGLPINMNGTEGPAAKRCREFATSLRATGYVVELADERLSSWEAEGRLIDAGHKPSVRKKKLHMASACVILEAFLVGRKSSQ